jgi:predicted flap endonuclease-1-like 5' DNA nuclease
MASLMEIEGIGPAYAERLTAAGIGSTEQLLELCGSAKGRSDAAAKTGIQESLILRWVNHADLFRIKGVSEEYADLLEAAGVDTVAELAQRNSENLQSALAATNEQTKRVKQVPAASQVAAWVDQAKTMPPMVTH